jgi:hypothetical protein
LEPFLAAVGRAMERPAVQCPPDGSPAREALHEAARVLPMRARLEPERAPGDADLMLRLATRWRTRTVADSMIRGATLLAALGIVRDVVARGPDQAGPRLPAWRKWLAAEDSLAESRHVSTATLVEMTQFVASIRGGEDPLAGSRDAMRDVRTILAEGGNAELVEQLDRFEAMVKLPWYFRWYGRPVLLLRMASEHDCWRAAIDEARTEAGLRGLLHSDRTSPLLRFRFLRAIEHAAVLNVARVALAVAAGEEPPALHNPLTGEPIEVRAESHATVVGAELPARFRAGAQSPELWSWTVPR